MSNLTNLPCPLCQTAITIDVYALLSGTSFACENCKASVAIAAAQKEVLQHTMDQFEMLKKGFQS
jgi:hypothetical protein